MSAALSTCEVQGDQHSGFHTALRSASRTFSVTEIDSPPRDITSVALALSPIQGWKLPTKQPQVRDLLRRGPAIKNTKNITLSREARPAFMCCSKVVLLSHKELDMLPGRAHVLPVLPSRDMGLYYTRCCSSAQKGPQEAGPAPATSFAHAMRPLPAPSAREASLQR